MEKKIEHFERVLEFSKDKLGSAHNTFGNFSRFLTPLPFVTTKP